MFSWDLFFSPNIHGKIVFRKGFFAKLQNVILQRPLAVQMKSSDWRLGFGYYFPLSAANLCNTAN